jgi:hypothetical protein
VTVAFPGRRATLILKDMFDRLEGPMEFKDPDAPSTVRVCLLEIPSARRGEAGKYY